jgi:hypothetical protein
MPKTMLFVPFTFSVFFIYPVFNKQKMLSVRNANPRDARIRFVENTHSYFIRENEGDEENAGYTSTTTFIHQLFPSFDADVIISKMMKSSKWSESKYYGMDAAEIKHGWSRDGSDAAAQGTSMHNNIEAFYNELPYDETTKEFALFKEFYNDHLHLEMYRTEWLIFAEDLKISGAIDAVFRDKQTGKFYIGDWKRCKEIKTSNHWEKGQTFFTSHLDNCNFVLYSMQLSVYKYILEHYYDMKIEGCFLVILHPKQASYIKMDILDLDTTVQKLMESRKRKVALLNDRHVN